MYSNPRQIIEDAQRARVHSLELATILHGLDSANPGTLADLTIDYSRRKPKPLSNFPIDSESLKGTALAFHKKAGTDTSDVIRNIESLTSDVPRIRIAHQANLFPSLGVVSQFFLMNSLAQQLSMQYEIIPSQMFIIVDYDIAQDQRFRVAHLPNVRGRLGTLHLTGAVEHDSFQKPMWVIAKPSYVLVREWITKLRMLMQQDAKALIRERIFERTPGFVEENIATLEALIWNAFERADSLVEFNAFILSQIVNVHWGMPTAFIFGSQIQPLMQDAYEFLIELWPEISSLVLKAISFFDEQGISVNSLALKRMLELLPIWITCTNHNNNEVCHRRVPLYTSMEKRLIAFGQCKYCRTDYKFDLGNFSKVNLDPLIYHGLAPRVLIDNILDAVGLGLAGGVGYLGQAEHMLLTNYIASNMNWEMPPHCLWKPRGFYYGLAECYAINHLWKNDLSAELKERSLAVMYSTYAGKASILYYLANLGLKGLFQQWNDFFCSGQEVYNINYGQAFSPLRLTGNLTKRLDLVSILEGEKDKLNENASLY